MRCVFNDGGRKDAGYKGEARDCVVRAIAIVTGKAYQEVYNTINVLGKDERITKRNKPRSTARMGVYRKTYDKYLKKLGWKWTPTMFIGQGCKVHMREEELPKGNIIVRVTKHLAAIIDGVLHDVNDCSRKGTRCVYGYYSK